MEYQAFSTMPRTVLVNSDRAFGHQQRQCAADDHAHQHAQCGADRRHARLSSIPPTASATPSTPRSTPSPIFETVEGMLVTIPNMVVADGFVSTSGGDPYLQAYSLDSANPDQINSRGGYTIAGDPPIGPPDTATPVDDTIMAAAVLHDGDVNPDIIEIDFTDFAIAPPPACRERDDGRPARRRHRHHRFRLHRPQAVRHRDRAGRLRQQRHPGPGDDRARRRQPRADRRHLQRRESRSGRRRRALHRARQRHRQQSQRARHHLDRGDAGQ